MKSDLRKDLNYKKVLLGLVLFSILFGALSVFIGELFIPMYVGVLGAVMLFEKGKFKPLSIACVLSVLGVSVLTFSYTPVIALLAPTVAFLIAFFYKTDRSKGECAGYSVVIFTLMLVLSLALLAMIETKEFSLSAVKEYYLRLYDSLGNYIQKAFDQMLEGIPEGSEGVAATEEYATLLLTTFVNSLPSLIVICAFLIVGASMKVFGFVVSRFTARPTALYRWRFSTSSPFVYFYLALFVLSIFAGGVDVFGIAVLNLYNVFTAVYAYIGFNFLRALLMMKKSAFFSTFILILSVVLLSSIALTVLAMFGVYFTIAKNKAKGKEGSDS